VPFKEMAGPRSISPPVSLSHPLVSFNKPSIPSTLIPTLSPGLGCWEPILEETVLETPSLDRMAGKVDYHSAESKVEGIVVKDLKGEIQKKDAHGATFIERMARVSVSLVNRF